jgi:hypothetical protein
MRGLIDLHQWGWWTPVQVGILWLACAASALDQTPHSTESLFIPLATAIGVLVLLLPAMLVIGRWVGRWEAEAKMLTDAVNNLHTSNDRDHAVIFSKLDLMYGRVEDHEARLRTLEMIQNIPHVSGARSGG